jgi:outer membrane receptor protein involved in Fe transport
MADSVWSYEVGEKAKLAGGKISFNADFYLMNWSGVQQQITPPCGYPYTTNAGNARAYGPEVEITVTPVHDLTFSLSGTVTSAKIRSVDPARSASRWGSPFSTFRGPR